MTEMIQTKSILAKLMATENLHVEQRQVATASFDVENRILTIPMLDKNVSNDEYDLFVGHEVGHALWTSYDDLKSAMDAKLSMSVLNVLEDSRIERKIKTKYPGIRHSFIRGYRALLEKNFFELDGRDPNEMPFIDRLNLHCKGGIEMHIHFTEDEMQLVNEVESTQTYADVLEVYKKIMPLVKEEEIEYQNKMKNKVNNENLENSDEDPNEFGENSEMESESSGGNSKESKSDEKSKTSKSAGGAGSGGNDGENGSNKDDSTGSAGGGTDQSISEEEIKARTNEALERNQNKLFSKDKTVYHYANIPEIDIKKAVVDHKIIWNRHRKNLVETGKNWNYGEDAVKEMQEKMEKEFLKFREGSKNIVSYLVKEFELRKNADQLKRASVAKTGDLNMSKIYSYKFSEDIFKKITVIPGGKSHGLVMFIDWSGSMANYIKETIEQLLNLVMFCKKVNIPYEVYAFTSEYREENDYEKGTYAPKKAGCMNVSPFRLMNLLSNRMNAQEFKYASSALLCYSNRSIFMPRFMGLGGTPLNEAVVSAMNIVPEFKQKNKLQIVNTVFLTDGDSNRVMNYTSPKGQEIIPKDIYNESMLVIRDPKTGHEETISSRQHASVMTSAYIKLLKYRTNCNIVGFYILAGRDLPNVMYRTNDRISSSMTELEEFKRKFRKDNYMVIKNAGYDEYYLLRHNGFGDEESDFEVDEDASLRSLATAFVKFNMSRKTSRVILNRFIGLIS